jgi:hypothetical protein
LSTARSQPCSRIVAAIDSLSARFDPARGGNRSAGRFEVLQVDLVDIAARGTRCVPHRPTSIGEGVDPRREEVGMR